MHPAIHHWFLPHASNNHRPRLLHPTSILAIIVFVLGFQWGLSKLESTFPQILGYASNITPQQVIDLTNLERKNHNLGELQADAQLSLAASQKAADMFARDYWAHVSPNGTQPWYFINESGYLYRYAGENLARDFTNAPAAVKAWMESPSHRENILNSKYQDIGIAVVDGKLGGRETTLIVQMFGTKGGSATQLSLPKIPALGVQAAEESPTAPNLTPKLSSFGVTKIITISLLGLFLIILILDIFCLKKNHVIRWTSKSLAHLIFLGGLLLASLLLSRGQIF